MKPASHDSTGFHQHIESISTICRSETLAIKEDPDEMLHNAAFRQDLHCLL